MHLRQLHPGAVGVEILKTPFLVGEFGPSGISRAIALSLPRGQSQPGANAAVPVLGERLGRLDGEAVQEVAAVNSSPASPFEHSAVARSGASIKGAHNITRANVLPA